MFRFAAVLFFILFASFAHADAIEDADQAWSAGKPWPAHWGLVKYPYTEGWNVVLLAFVNKIYDQDEAADTWLKHMPSAMPKGASIEMCMMKRGLLEVAGFCKPAVVDPAIIGTLKVNDVVALLYSNHGTKRFSSGPGSDPRTTLRAFQKISAADDSSCWRREALLFKRPIADDCFKMVDKDLVERLLTRDFGPRAGVTAAAMPAAEPAAPFNTQPIDMPEPAPAATPAAPVPADLPAPAAQATPPADATVSRAAR